MWPQIVKSRENLIRYLYNILHGDVYMKINNLLEQLDTSERKEESLLSSIAMNVAKKDKKRPERPMRMLNMLEKVVEGKSIDKESNEMIKESLEEIETRLFMKKEGISLGYFPGIQTNLLMFSFLTELKNIDTSSAYDIKDLYENKKKELVSGDWFIIENGQICLYPNGRAAVMEWTQKTGLTLNENRFYLRVKLLKEDKLAERAEYFLKKDMLAHDIREFYES